MLIRLFSWAGLFLFFIALPAFAAHFENPVELTIKVEDGSFNLKVKDLKFNGEEIKLDPSDMFKPRKIFQTKLQPGRYSLVWSTEKTQTRWSEEPTKLHEKTLVLESGDTLVKINIKGDVITMY
jgi:hypothetical protein